MKNSQKSQTIKRHLKTTVKRLFKPQTIDRFLNAWKGLQGAQMARDSFAATELENIKKNRLLAQTDNYGINVLGYLKGELGLGESLRAFAHAIQRAQIPVAFNNVDAGGHRNQDTTFTHFQDNNPYAVNLIGISPDWLPATFKVVGPEYFKGKYNIGLWYWELPEIPPNWHSVFPLFDEIWVTSDFCASAIAKVSPIPVVKITYPLQLKQPSAQYNRSYFQLPEDVWTFVFSFDFSGGSQRKNPVAIIEAFARAFTKHDRVALVIKTINSRFDSTLLQQMQQKIQNLNVHVIDKHLAHEEVLGLFACCDCLISLHRAEGLGLGMAEAMSLGKPVIATGYSGNMEFMNVNNSFPVKYQLAELSEDYGLFTRGNRWADPDIAHATELMRYVYENQESAIEIGRRAATDIKNQLNLEQTGLQIKQRLKILIERNSSEAALPMHKDFNLNS